MKPLYKILIALAFVLLVAGLFGWMVLHPSTITFNDGTLSFAYPNSYKETSRPAPSTNQSHTLLRAEHLAPVSHLELAKETSAIIGANITKTDFLTYLEKNIEKSLPLQYTNNYKHIATTRIKIGSKDASMVSFSCTGSDNKTTLYASYIIIPAGNDDYYLTLQSVSQQSLQSDSMLVQQSLRLQ